MALLAHFQACNKSLSKKGRADDYKTPLMATIICNFHSTFSGCAAAAVSCLVVVADAAGSSNYMNLPAALLVVSTINLPAAIILGHLFSLFLSCGRADYPVLAGRSGGWSKCMPA